MSIGNIRYGLVKLTGKVLSVSDDEVTVQAGDLSVKIATEYVYGNAIRDASRLVEIKNFVNTTDLNSISEAMNKRVRNVVLPPFKSKVKKDDNVSVIGAVELNEAHYSLTTWKLYLFQCKIIQQ